MSEKKVGHTPEVDLLKTREQLYLELTHERKINGELLEACRRLLWARRNEYQCNMPKAIEMAEKAISKAGGR